MSSVQGSTASTIRDLLERSRCRSKSTLALESLCVLVTLYVGVWFLNGLRSNVASQLLVFVTSDNLVPCSLNLYFSWERGLLITAKLCKWNTWVSISPVPFHPLPSCLSLCMYANTADSVMRVDWGGFRWGPLYLLVPDWDWSGGGSELSYRRSRRSSERARREGGCRVRWATLARSTLTRWNPARSC